MAQLPNLIIIGSPKCGTTSLYYYLGLHPEIFMSREKELNFFIGRKELASRARLVSGAVRDEPIGQRLG